MKKTILTKLSRWILVVRSGWLVVIFIVLLMLSFNPNASSWAQSLLCVENNSSIPVSKISVSAREGESDTYQMKLCKEPTANVTVIPKEDKSDSGEIDQITFSPTQLIFSKDNYSHTQTITVTAKDDSISEGNLTVLITHTISTTDGFYGKNQDGIPIQVSIEITDNDWRAYMPIVSKSRLPVWAAIGYQARPADVVQVSQNSLIVGLRRLGSVDGGVHKKGGECSDGNLVLGNISVRDIAFKNDLGVTATFNDRAYYSTDKGDNWSQSKPTTMNPFVYAVEFVDANHVYAGTDNGLYRSTDGGANWSDIVPPSATSPSSIYSLYFDNTQPNSLWVGSFKQGVWKADLGDNVTIVQMNDGDLSADSEIWGIIVDATDTYVATSKGVYKRSGSSPWVAYGLQDRQVLSLAIVKDQQDMPGKYMYAGLNGGGVQRTVIGSTNPTWVDVSPLNQTSLTVRDLYFDATSLCNGLLAATSDGIWLYR